MFRHLRPVWAEINLDNLANNMQEIRKVAKSKDIIAVVKGDAYGHGALDVAPVFLENGATRLAVAVISEAIELRRGGIDSPLMILGFTPPDLIESLLRYNIEQTVYSYEFAKQLSKKAKERKKIAKVHIAVETGMGRIGYQLNEKSIKEIYEISKLPNIQIEGIFSHFSTADEKDKTYTSEQFMKFNKFYNQLMKLGVKIKIRHIANSAAILDLPETHLEAVRPGIIQYGYYPSNEVDYTKVNIKPAMELKTNIVQIKELQKGEYIGYGKKFITKRKSLIATLPVGYADGYTRAFFDKAEVIIKDNFAPVVGRICMDQCMVDVTDIPDIKEGEEVILMGKSKDKQISAEDLANAINSISYEVLCMISKRVPRVYIKNGKVVNIRNYI